MTDDPRMPTMDPDPANAAGQNNGQDSDTGAAGFAIPDRDETGMVDPDNDTPPRDPEDPDEEELDDEDIGGDDMDDDADDPDFNDPDAQNSEQSEAGTHAQDVADDARALGTAGYGDPLASEHGGHANRAQVSPEDTPDLIDHMNDMDRSGRIDMDAFAGEPDMDDEDGRV